MSDTYDPYDAKVNHMRGSLPEEREAYERMLGKMSNPLMQEQEHMRQVNKLMRQIGKLKEKLEEYDNYIQWLCQFVPEDRWDEVYEDMTKMGIDYRGADDV